MMDFIKRLFRKLFARKHVHDWPYTPVGEDSGDVFVYCNECDEFKQINVGKYE